LHHHDRAVLLPKFDLAGMGEKHNGHKPPDSVQSRVVLKLRQDVEWNFDRANMIKYMRLVTLKIETCSKQWQPSCDVRRYHETVERLKQTGNLVEGGRRHTSFFRTRRHNHRFRQILMLASPFAGLLHPLTKVLAIERRTVINESRPYVSTALSAHVAADSQTHLPAAARALLKRYGGIELMPAHGALAPAFADHAQWGLAARAGLAPQHDLVIERPYAATERLNGLR